MAGLPNYLDLDSDGETMGSRVACGVEDERKAKCAMRSVDFVPCTKMVIVDLVLDCF